MPTDNQNPNLPPAPGVQGGNPGSQKVSNKTIFIAVGVVVLIFLAIVIAGMVFGFRNAREKMKGQQELDITTKGAFTETDLISEEKKALSQCNFPENTSFTTEGIIESDRTYEENGQLIRELIIDSSNYCIIEISGVFKRIFVAGFYDMPTALRMPASPVLPASINNEFQLDVGKEYRIVKADIIPENKVELENLNIPCSNIACPNCIGCKCTGGYYDCSDKLDDFPIKMGYDDTDYSIGRVNDSWIRFEGIYPVIHNFKTKKTFLYQNFRIKIYLEKRI